MQTGLAQSSLGTQNLLSITYHGPTVLKSDGHTGPRAPKPLAHMLSLRASVCRARLARQAERVLLEEHAPELTGG